MASGDQEAVALCAKALAMSGVSPATRSHLLNNRGLALIQTGDNEGYAALQESLRVALDAGEPEHACRAYVNLAWLEVERRLDGDEHLYAIDIEPDMCGKIDYRFRVYPHHPSLTLLPHRRLTRRLPRHGDLLLIHR